jgi:hypothetical protein
MRRLHPFFLGLAAASGLLAVSATSDAGTKDPSEGAACNTHSDGTTTCAFEYLGTRNDSTSDWTSFGVSIGNGTYGWDNGTYGWFVGVVGGTYHSCTASGNVLAQWPLIMGTRQWVQVDMDPSGNCIHIQAIRDTSDDVY